MIFLSSLLSLHKIKKEEELLQLTISLYKAIESWRFIKEATFAEEA
jgi:hypothetical protein